MDDFLIRGSPCIVSRRRWSEDGTVPVVDRTAFLSALKDAIGDKTFQVECCDGTTPSPACMTFASFLARVESSEALYLKEVHVDLHAPGLRDLFPVTYPGLLSLQDDWLGHYYSHYRRSHPQTDEDIRLDDYTFLYFGGKGSFTGVHHDVLRSHSWSTNVIGRKKWTFWHPSATSRLLHSQELVRDARPDRFSQADFPDVASTPCVEIIQDELETMFVPSGWHHMVENLDDITVSVNCNWINGMLVDEVWQFLLQELNSVRKEIWHVKSDECHTAAERELAMSSEEWQIHCAKLQRANSALSMHQFVELIAARIAYLLTIRDSLEVFEHDSSSKYPWLSSLCPLYAQGLYAQSKEDRGLFLRLVATDVISSSMSPSDLLSFYSQPDVSPSAIKLARDDTIDRDSSDRVTLLSLSCLAVRKIIRDILGSSELLLHISCCYSLTVLAFTDAITQLLRDVDHLDKCC
jgi:Cupin-like domain